MRRFAGHQKGEAKRDEAVFYRTSMSSSPTTWGYEERIRKLTIRRRLYAVLREFSHELKGLTQNRPQKRCLTSGIYVAPAVAELAKQSKEEFEVVMVRNDRDTRRWI
jgi:hypothetical protein